MHTVSRTGQPASSSMVDQADSCADVGTASQVEQVEDLRLVLEWREKSPAW